MSSSEERIVIKFDDHGEKKFVTYMVMGSLKKSDRQPPAEKKRTSRKKAASRHSLTAEGPFEEQLVERTSKTVI